MNGVLSWSRWGRSLVLPLALALGPALGCNDNMFVGTLTPVPPVHRLPAQLEGAVLLMDRDPVIETRDPNHVVRANDQQIPQQYRAAMERALALGGFRVVREASASHAVAARLAIAVTEKGDDIRQVYRCRIEEPGGAVIAQIDWPWPKGVFVEVTEVLDYAAHNLATEVVRAPPVRAALARTPAR